MSVLAVSSAADARALYALLRDDLARLLPGQDEPVRDLALLGVRHAALQPVTRGVLLGPPSVDVGGAMQLIADVIGVPHLRVPLGMVSGHGWQGAGLPEWLELVHSAPYGRLAVVTLADLEALRISRGAYTGLDGRAERWLDDLGRAVAQVLAGDSVRGERRETETYQLLVVVTGEGDGLPVDPGPGDYVDWGLTPAVARPLGVAQLVRTTEPSGEALSLALLDRMDAEYYTYQALGLRLDVDPATLTYAVAALARADYGGVDAAAGWLVAAARRGLAQLLGEGGEAYTIAPDDLNIPDPPRGRWTE